MAQPAPTKFAVILPLKSADFASAAQAVRQGILRAREVVGAPVDIVVLESDDTPQSVLSAFEQAQSLGARWVIGPLTRRAVNTLATRGPMSIPTLALNNPDPGLALPEGLWTLSLSIETEARQVAQAAWQQARLTDHARGGAGIPTAVIVYSNNGLSRRAAQSFEATFRAAGGDIALQMEASAGDLRQKLMLQTSAVLFLATDAATAREIRPATQRFIVFGTSQLFEGRQTRWQDLDGVRFVDQPWMLQPDHAAVMVFPRSEVKYSAELERLYALGIDAYRLALELSRGQHSGFELDGVTGQLQVRTQRIERQALPAIFREGEPVLDTAP